MITQMQFSLRHAVVLACFVLSSCIAGFAQSRMTVRRNVHRDVSDPLREMILHAPPPSLEKHEAEPVSQDSLASWTYSTRRLRSAKNSRAFHARGWDQF